MGRGDSDVIEQAEPHCLIVFGVVTRGTYRAKDRASLGFHDQIDSQYPRASSTFGSGQRAGGHHRISIDLDRPVCGGHVIDPRNILSVVNAFQSLPADLGGIIAADDEIQPRHQQLIVDCLKPLAAFGVKRASVVFQTVGMRNKT